jgi:iron complex outermembrane receptor protein
LLSNLGEHVTSRLQLMANHVVREDTGGMGAAIAGFGTTRNPSTGKYEPGVVWALDQTGATAIATSTTVPLPAPTSIVFSRTTNAVDLFYNEIHFRNDYAVKFEEPGFKSTTIAGLAANASKVQFKTYATASRPNLAITALDTITYPAWNYPAPTAANGGGNRTGKQEDLQFFVYENLSLVQDRLILTGGVSRFFGNLDRTDSTGIGAMPFPHYGTSTTAKSYGVVVKPIKEVSLFYSYNSSGGTMPGSLNPGTYGPTFRAASGDQQEFGVKTSLLDGRLTGSFAYFKIAQQNYSVPNSDYYTLIAQGKTAEANALQNPLYLDLNSKGWEFEGQFAVTKNFFVLGNYTSFKIRQPITEVRVRAVPDRSGAVYADYRFTEGQLAGFGISVGVDFKSDVVGENATGYTTTKPLPNGSFVANQPTFLVAGRTLVNVGLAYRAKDWTARLQVNNALDKDYILAAGSRTAAVPRNLKLSLSYKY